MSRNRLLLWLLGVVTRRLLHTGTTALLIGVRDPQGDGGETWVEFDRRWRDTSSAAWRRGGR